MRTQQVFREKHEKLPKIQPLCSSYDCHIREDCHVSIDIKIKIRSKIVLSSSKGVGLYLETSIRQDSSTFFSVLGLPSVCGVFGAF